MQIFKLSRFQIFYSSDSQISKFINFQSLESYNPWILKFSIFSFSNFETFKPRNSSFRNKTRFLCDLNQKENKQNVAEKIPCYIMYPNPRKRSVS